MQFIIVLDSVLAFIGKSLHYNILILLVLELQKVNNQRGKFAVSVKRKIILLV